MDNPLDHLLAATTIQTLRSTEKHTLLNCLELLPFRIKGNAERYDALKILLTQLYLAIKTGDYRSEAQYWTEELKRWSELNGDLPRNVRATLVKIYYQLALSPGMDHISVGTFTRMVRILVHGQNDDKLCRKDLTLNWRPMYDQLKAIYLNTASSCILSSNRPVEDPSFLCWIARDFFDPQDNYTILEQILPHFNTADSDGSVGVVSMIWLMVPTSPAPETALYSQLSDILPVYFQLHAYEALSVEGSFELVEVFSRLARSHLEHWHTSFAAYGIFDKTQSSEIFTAVGKLLLSDEDPEIQSISKIRRFALTTNTAVWIVYSLSPFCNGQNSSILSDLSCFIASVQAFYNPAVEEPPWLGIVALMLQCLTQEFCGRWNKEKEEALSPPPERKIDDELKRQFVLLLQGPVLSGCFSTNRSVSGCCIEATRNLAYLEPDLVLPAALHRFYAGRDSSQIDACWQLSALRLLHRLSSIISKQKGFRCHVPTLVAFALEGIGAYDLKYTNACLQLIRTMLCNPWTQFSQLGGSQDMILVMTAEGPDIEMDYHAGTSDEQEIEILCSSASGFANLTSVLLDKVFDFMMSSGADPPTTEFNQILNGLITEVCMEWLKALSPELLDRAIKKLAECISSTAMPSAATAAGLICSAACTANPEKALKSFIPMLIRLIRHEIAAEDNTIASVEGLLSKKYPYLSWYAEILQNCLRKGGHGLLQYEADLLGLARFVQEKCLKRRGSTFVGPFISSLLQGLTDIYVVGSSWGFPDSQITKEQLLSQHWDKMADDLSAREIRWHCPTPIEVRSAYRVFMSQITDLGKRLRNLVENDKLARNTNWALDISDALSHARELFCGVATLFDPYQTLAAKYGDDDESDRVHARGHGFKPILERSSPLYADIQKLRQETGSLVSRVHNILTDLGEENRSCFRSLYSLYKVLVDCVGFCNCRNLVNEHREVYLIWARDFKLSGLQKECYPRPLHVQRALVYYQMWQKFRSGCRHMDNLEKQILRDLVDGCTSRYDDVRGAAVKVLVCSLATLTGSALFVVPMIINKLESLIERGDQARVKSALNTLLEKDVFQALHRHCCLEIPRFIRLCMRTSSIDWPWVRELSEEIFDSLANFNRALEEQAFVDESIVDVIRPAGDFSDKIQARCNAIISMRAELKKQKTSLGIELLRSAADSQFYLPLIKIFFYDFEGDIPPEYIHFLAEGAIARDSKLRSVCGDDISDVIDLSIAKCTFAYDLEAYLCTQGENRSSVAMIAPGKDTSWTDKYLTQFRDFHDIREDETFVDDSRYGSFVWGTELETSLVDVPSIPDNCEFGIIGSYLTREWFEAFFRHMQEEPEDSDEIANPRLRPHDVRLLVRVFNLMGAGKAVAQLQDIRELAMQAFGDGESSWQHVAMAGIMLALFLSSTTGSRAFQRQVMDFITTIGLHIFKNKLTSENIFPWQRLFWELGNFDPRRYPQLLQDIVSFRLDPEKSSFQNAQQLHAIRWFVVGLGWRFRHERPIVADLLAHGNSDRGVCYATAGLLAEIYNRRHHDSFCDVRTQMDENRAQSSIGIRSYSTGPQIAIAVFRKLEELRRECTSQAPSKTYIYTCLMVLEWLGRSIRDPLCGQLIEFVPVPILNELFHMMSLQHSDMKEIAGIATINLFLLAKLPFQKDECQTFLEALINKAKSSDSLRQRKKALKTIRLVYLERLLKNNQQEQIFVLNSLSRMLEDSQVEFREQVSSELSTLICRTRLTVAEPIINALSERYAKILGKWKQAVGTTGGCIKQRHAAVMGLSSLIEASHHITLPPPWVCRLLLALGNVAHADDSMVGKSADAVIAKFREARRANWDDVSRCFTAEELELLQSSRGRSYFS
ncbi:hypothetical protein BKA67DRAFT_663210 [Truncatella angustata]|uniref:Proteasome activator complex subunit 4 n=1 Tax=Truncatella angustata TaxID=152316 RepID=A0A9P8UCL2_9PEZI|nr:uncharacterized protein BKA67DRAFT_663210 [Truncatella angustata]KAH6646836.1 hypothetical protein BKA67DRAFT_663210 [Truncatella angustata]